MQGYKNDKAWIVAQNPMKSTVNDFWKMVVDEQVPAIVMLCSPDEEQRVSIHALSIHQSFLGNVWYCYD